MSWTQAHEDALRRALQTPEEQAAESDLWGAGARERARRERAELRRTLMSEEQP